MMAEIIELTKINFSSVLIAVFVILIGVKAIVSLLEWVIEQLGLETKWMRKRREEQALLIQTAQELSSLQEHHKKDMERSDRRDEEIASDIKKLTQMFVDKEIDDMRWEINNFATNVAEGKPCNKDSFTHCIRTYEKYERILKENHLENGEVDYGTIAGLIDNQKELLSMLPKMYVALKDVPAEELQKEFISRLAEIIHEEGKEKS